MIGRSNIIVRGFLSASNFVNKNGQHPPLLYAMLWNKIVVDKEDLCNGVWMYVGDEDRDCVINQLKFLKIHDDWFPIIKK